MTTDPLVSVLTPVYNGEVHLDECIQSVLRQTYSNWEYVIVDNASTDGTAAIAERYASTDGRIRLARASEFLDVYGNHNRALGQMDPRSRYCKFVQADDWMYPQCLERMVEVAQLNPSVGLVTAYALNGTQVQLDGLFQYWQTVLPGSEAVRRLISGTWYDWVVGGPSSVLLRTDLVRRDPEFYDRTIWHADTDAAFRVLMSSDLGFVHQVMTFMRADNPRALTSFSLRVYTYLPMEGRMLIRFGPKVMSASEYRRRIRIWLWRYGRWLAKQMLKPTRHRQEEFLDFHTREIDGMIADAGQDRETRAILSILRLLPHNRPRAEQGLSGSALAERLSSTSN